MKAIQRYFVHHADSYRKAIGIVPAFREILKQVQDDDIAAEKKLKNHGHAVPIHTGIVPAPDRTMLVRPKPGRRANHNLEGFKMGADRTTEVTLSGVEGWVLRAGCFSLLRGDRGDGLISVRAKPGRRANQNFQGLLLILLLAAFSSCRKNVTVKLPEYTEKLVVEASIETGQPAQVLLSVTAPYFGNVDLTDPTKFFVKGAFVTVSDGTQTDTLIEPFPATGYYYQGSKVMGQVGKTYFLTIHANGKSYTATTSILNPIALDSIYTKHEKDSLGFCWGHLTDPPGVGNCYRWFAKRLMQDQFFAAPFNSAFDDKFVDGKSFDFGYERPPQPDKHEEYNAEPDVSRGYYRVGDTIVVKFCTIGIPEYLFWRSYYDNKSSNGNPFSSPSNLQNTIQGDAAIGAFCGYSTTFDTLVFRPK